MQGFLLQSVSVFTSEHCSCSGFREGGSIWVETPHSSLLPALCPRPFRTPVSTTGNAHAESTPLGAALPPRVTVSNAKYSFPLLWGAEHPYRWALKFSLDSWFLCPQSTVGVHGSYKHGPFDQNHSRSRGQWGKQSEQFRPRPRDR